MYNSDGLGTFGWQKNNGFLVAGLNHIVGTYDGNGALDGWDGAELYVNANPANTAVSNPLLSADFVPTSFHLGKYSSPAKYINDKMSLTRFWSRELSQSDVTYLYNNGQGRPSLDL